MSQTRLVCPECGVPLIATPGPWGGAHCPKCARRYDESGRPVAQAARPPAPPAHRVQRPDTLNRMIPAGNPNALIAYYLGVFAVFPCIGLFLAIPAMVLGAKGLQLARSNPEARGATHAWVGIIAGALFTIVWGGLGLWTLVEVLAERP